MSLDIKKDQKINEMYSYSYSEAIKKITINNSNLNIIATYDNLSHFDCTLRDIELKNEIEEELETEVIVDCEVNEGVYITANLAQLHEIRVKAGEIWRHNRKVLIGNEEEIGLLENETDVENYDFTIGFLVDQNINIGGVINEN